MTVAKRTDRGMEAANELLASLVVAGLGVAWIASLLHLTPGPLAWVILRSLGLVSYVSLAASTALGALLGGRFTPRWLARASQYGWHGVLSGLALASGAFHGAFLMVDGQYPQPLAAILVPGLSSVRPLPVGLGTLGVELLAVVYLSTALKNRLSQRAWRALHLLSYPAFVLTTLHGLLGGSDNLTLLYLAGTAAAAATLVLRLVMLRVAPATPG